MERGRRRPLNIPVARSILLMLAASCHGSVMRISKLPVLGLTIALIPLCYLTARRPNAAALSDRDSALQDALNDSDDFGNTKGRTLRFKPGSQAEPGMPGAPVLQNKAGGAARSPRSGQCPIESTQAEQLLGSAGLTGNDGLQDAARLHQWLADRRNFKPTAGGGKTIGKTGVQDLLSSRQLTGCHDWALMKSALLNCAGYEAQLVDTAGVDWMNAVRSGKLGRRHNYEGHVFVEANIAGRWILLDSVSPRYIPDYDRASPLIPIQVGSQDSYCVMFKGKDPPSYGIDSVETLNRRMDEFAGKVDPAKLDRPNSQVRDLPSVDASRP